MIEALKKATKRLPPIRRIVEQRDALAEERGILLAERDALRAERAGMVDELDRYRHLAGPGPYFVPPGHFYSPIPAVDQAIAQRERLFAEPPRELPALDLDEPGQLAMLEVCEGLYGELPFPEHAAPDTRYFYENESFRHADAILLYSMIRHLRPQRIIEVGSGYSSCVTLDVNDLFFSGAIDCTFIEPYPDLLRSLLGDVHDGSHRLLESPVQDVPADVFSQLRENDILFIDSTHVSKIGSDVNYLLFEVLPVLASGVHIHFHDMFYPFEYPEDWVLAGRAWNESYLLRAFLSYNRDFEVVLFGSFLQTYHAERLAKTMPLFVKRPAASLWLRRR